MITANKVDILPSKISPGKIQSRACFHLVGLSTDEKPVETYGDYLIGNGSEFLEMDTSTTYRYDEEGVAWTAPEE